MDVNKRAVYDDEILNSGEGVYYIKIWKFKINVIVVTILSLVFFVSYYIRNKYKILRMKYYCPLGEDKFSVDKLKFSDQNISLLNFIEITKEEMRNTKKIAEDDEYEYYVENIENTKI